MDEHSDKLHLLIVDDDPISQQTMSVAVRSLGHQLEVVSNGRDAVHAVERRRFDVVLMDLHMPVMDGVAATLEIRRRLPPENHPAIIATTSSDAPGDVQRCLDAGMDPHLPKPIDRQRLANVLISIRNTIAQRPTQHGDDRIRVLLIDDDPVITALYERHLQRAGFAAAVANDSVEGFVKLQIFQPDVVLLDLNMPYRSGAEWLSQLRGTAKYSHLPVVIVTGLPADSPEVKSATESGATNVLFKNQSSPEAVIAAVSWAVDQLGQAGGTGNPERRR